jgi:hypothetical protein
MTPEQRARLPVTVHNALCGERVEPNDELVQDMIDLLLGNAWTRTVPTAPGLYWNRGKPGSTAALVRLYERPVGVVYEANHGELGPGRLGGEWAGPVVCP